MINRSVITIGNFDGVHLGHEAILRRARAIADEHDARVVVLTFDPHPATVLRPGAEPPRLCRFDDRVVRLKTVGADEVKLLATSTDLLGQTAEQFIENLVREHRPVAIVEGDNFRFGKERGGDMNLLQRLGERFGFTVAIEPDVEAVLSDQLIAPISSSLVRWLVGRGRMVDAATCLDQPFSITATVAQGERRGQVIGVPTINLDPADYRGQIVPSDGVYAGFAEIGSQESGVRSQYPAAISVGVKPTFGHDRLTVEAHLLDFEGDLYGRTVELRFERWVRDQYPFPGIDALQDQLRRDIQVVRDWSCTRVQSDR